MSYWARTISREARELARRFWPGPLTIVLPRSTRAGDAITGGQDAVALRVPSHPAARELRQRTCSVTEKGTSIHDVSAAPSCK